MQLDRKYIEEHHLVPRYLADQLPEAERAAFEDYYLAHPEILAELEAVARLKVGLTELQRSGELPKLLRPRRALWRFVAAAAIAAMLVAASLSFMRPAAKRPLLASLPTQLADAAGKPLAVITTRYVMRLRSGGYDVQVPASTQPQAIELRILPEHINPLARYRMEIVRVDGPQPAFSAGRLEDLQPAADGYIEIYMDSTQLSPGIYELRLGWHEGASTTTTSTFLLQAL